MNQRAKGHNFERKIAKFLREKIGHDRCRSTRSSSRMLDACGIDLVGTNALFQCKAGYERRRIRFEEEYDYIKERLNQNFPKDHKIQNYPVIVICEIDVGQGNKRGPQHTQVTMTLEDFGNLMTGVQQEILDIL